MSKYLWFFFVLLAATGFLAGSAFAQTGSEPAKPAEFRELLFKWEREAEMGNFLMVKARLNSKELIEAHPRYNEKSRANMLELVANETIFFLWLDNTGVDQIRASFGDFILKNDAGEEFLPSSFSALDGKPITREFSLPPGEERGLTLHYPKLIEPLGQVQLRLEKCRYTFVAVNVELNWDFGPLGAQMDQLRQKKVRLKILQSELARLVQEQQNLKLEIEELKNEVQAMELKNLKHETTQRQPPTD